LASAEEGDELAVEFTRLFDVGASGPPCPLYGGLYGGARMKTMEEAVRFYNHFGLTLSDGPRELPDHLSTQLEFLHYLAYREAEALQAGTDTGPYQRAQRDFITRQPGAWVPKLCERVVREDAPVYYRVLLSSLADLLAWDGARLAASAPNPAD
jgi:DMSO reductase family type II enzyme chaperone